MRYGIITLPNSDRDIYKNAIREHVRFPELELEAFDARVLDPAEGIRERGLILDSERWGNPKRGELGVWLSNFDRWQQASETGPLIVFEDDAVVDKTFIEKFNRMMEELPRDWDFAALWVPENQRQDYLYNYQYDPFDDTPLYLGRLPSDLSIYRIRGARFAALVYQGYGMVSLVYSQEGGRKLVERARATGITTPVDCWIYEQAKLGHLKGYAPHPDRANIVHYDWSAATTIQDTEML